MNAPVKIRRRLAGTAAGLSALGAGVYCSFTQPRPVSASVTVTAPPIFAPLPPTIVQAAVWKIDGPIVTLAYPNGVDLSYERVDISRAVYETPTGQRVPVQPLHPGESLVVALGLPIPTPAAVSPPPFAAVIERNAAVPPPPTAGG